MAIEPLVLSLRVERGGKTATYEVHGGTVLIGSGSHCDVRLLPEDAAPEQLRIELRGGEVHVQSLAPERDCRLDGVPFKRGVLAAESALKLGQASLRAAPTHSQDRKPGSGSAGSWPPAVRVLGFAAIAAGLYLVLQEKPVADLLDRTVEHPALFGAPVTECSIRGDDPAAFQAGRIVRDANLKGERAPFYPRDGVSAVARYEEAAACLQRAGLAAEAKAAEQAASALRRTLSDEFHVRHVRLERFLGLKKYAAAQREVRVLQDFLHRQDGPYAQWLAAVQRELNTRFATAKKQG